MAQDDLKVVVIGFGDPDRGDAAVGLDIISELKHAGGFDAEWRAIEGDLPWGFLDDVPQNALIIVIDAIHSESPLGTVHCLKLPSNSVQLRHLGPQGSERLRSEIERLRQQGRAPARLFLVGIEISAGDAGKELSQEARKAVDEVVRNFGRYLKLARDLTA